MNYKELCDSKKILTLVKNQATHLKEQAGEAGKQVEKSITQHPVKSVSVAFAAGMATMGLLYLTRMLQKRH